eukprot:11560-Heterococcus_DN1.PRE.1
MLNVVTLNLILLPLLHTPIGAAYGSLAGSGNGAKAKEGFGRMAQGVTMDELTCSQEEAVTAASEEASTRGAFLPSYYAICANATCSASLSRVLLPLMLNVVTLNLILLPLLHTPIGAAYGSLAGSGNGAKAKEGFGRMAQGVTMDELTCSQEEAVTAASEEASTRGAFLPSYYAICANATFITYAFS